MEPYYDRDGITIYCGDCRDVLPQIAPGSVDLVLTDPPYGFGLYESDIVADISLLKPFLHDGITVAAFGYPEVLTQWVVDFQQAPNEWVTWWPTNKMAARTPGLPRESECVAIWGAVPGANLLTRARVQDRMTLSIHESRGNNLVEARLGDVWRDPSPGMGFNHHLRKHPNEKPLTLLTRLLILCGGTAVLDPFMGSGTTLRAAKDLGRKAIGIEIEERYCEVAVQRLSQIVLPLGDVA